MIDEKKGIILCAIVKYLDGSERLGTLYFDDDDATPAKVRQFVSGSGQPLELIEIGQYTTIADDGVTEPNTDRWLPRSVVSASGTPRGLFDNRPIAESFS